MFVIYGIIAFNKVHKLDKNQPKQFLFSIKILKLLTIWTAF